MDRHMLSHTRYKCLNLPSWYPLKIKSQSCYCEGVKRNLILVLTDKSRSRSVAHTKARNKVSKNFESNSHSNWFQPASEASLMTEQNQQRGPQQNCFTSQIYFLLMTPTFTKLHTVYRLNQGRFFSPYLAMPQVSHDIWARSEVASSLLCNSEVRMFI